VVLMALWRLGKVPALLNFSTGTPMMLTCAQLGGIRVVISSRAFVERGRIDVKPFESAEIQVLYLEDLRARISGPQKLAALARQSIAPSLRNSSLFADKAAVILFTGYRPDFQLPADFSQFRADRRHVAGPGARDVRFPLPVAAALPGRAKRV
jgi:hypothetical protein